MQPFLLVWQGGVRWEAHSALQSQPLNLVSLSAASWYSAFDRLLQADHNPTSDRELEQTDPFFQWMSPQRCSREVYIDSGDARVPPLRRCKLAALCPVLHIEDAPYARCLGVSTGLSVIDA